LADQTVPVGGKGLPDIRLERLGVCKLEEYGHKRVHRDKLRDHLLHLPTRSYESLMTVSAAWSVCPYVEISRKAFAGCSVGS
jgi:hypothetical protein